MYPILQRKWMFLMLFENTLYLWCKKYINLENIKYSTIITKTYRKSKKNNPFLITLIARQKSFFLFMSFCQLFIILVINRCKMSKFGLTCSIKTKGYNARFIQFERYNFSVLGFSKFENEKFICIVHYCKTTQ